MLAELTVMLLVIDRGGDDDDDACGDDWEDGKVDPERIGRATYTADSKVGILKGQRGAGKGADEDADDIHGLFVLVVPVTVTL